MRCVMSFLRGEAFRRFRSREAAIEWHYYSVELKQAHQRPLTPRVQIQAFKVSAKPILTLRPTSIRIISSFRLQHTRARTHPFRQSSSDAIALPQPQRATRDRQDASRRQLPPPPQASAGSLPKPRPLPNPTSAARDSAAPKIMRGPPDDHTRHGSSPTQC